MEKGIQVLMGRKKETWQRTRPTNGHRDGNPNGQKERNMAKTGQKPKQTRREGFNLFLCQFPARLERYPSLGWLVSVTEKL